MAISIEDKIFRDHDGDYSVNVLVAKRQRGRLDLALRTVPARGNSDVDRKAGWCIGSHLVISWPFEGFGYGLTDRWSSPYLVFRGLTSYASLLRPHATKVICPSSSMNNPVPHIGS